MLAGGIAGMVARTTIAPIERIKIMFQISRSSSLSTRSSASSLAVNSSFAPIFHRILANEGILSLWKGNSAAVVRVIPYMAIQFYAYDKSKDFITVSLFSSYYLPSTSLTLNFHFS